MEEGAFKILTGTPAGKIPLERPRQKWEENIRDKEINISTRNWGDSAQGTGYWIALVNFMDLVS